MYNWIVWGLRTFNLVLNSTYSKMSIDLRNGINVLILLNDILSFNFINKLITKKTVGFKKRPTVFILFLEKYF